MGAYIVVAIIAYLLGSISFSVIFSKKFAGIDVRTVGSKNAGATNTLRTAGKKAAILTLLCDVLKGVISVLIAFLIGLMFDNVDKSLLVQIAGVSVVIGHVFPIFFKFKGGKGVATSLGVLLMINWQIALICLVFALVIMILTKMVSAGSILAAVLFPVLTIFISQNYLIPEGSYIVFGIILAVIVIVLHRENIKKILSGNENKLSFSKKENK